MIYEIANPSDAYTMKADDEEAAVLACLFLGEGSYVISDEKGESVMPFFMFGGDPDAWIKEKYGHSLEVAMKEKGLLVADALESVLIGNRQDRRDYEEAITLMTPENAKQFEALRHDRHRSSLNNIGKRAKQLAAHFRKKAGEVQTT